MVSTILECVTRFLHCNYLISLQYTLVEYTHTMKLATSLLSYIPFLHGIHYKKTIIDIGPEFKVSKYYDNYDISVASLPCSHETTKCAIFIPGIDMSGLSVCPHVYRLSEEMDTYTIVSHDSKFPDMHDMVNCVDDLMDDICDKYEEISFIGESCGAIVALNSIGDCKDKVKQLILLNPATEFWRMENKEDVSKKLTSPIDIMKNSPRFSDMSQSIRDIGRHGYYMALVYMIYNQLFLSPVSSIHRVDKWMGETESMTMKCLQDIQCVVKVIIGEKDGLIPQNDCHLTFEKIENFKEIVISDGTHLITPNLMNIFDVFN